MTNFPEIIIIISVVNHTAHKREYRGIAKLVRHWILNPACVGSSPATPAIELSAVPTGAAFLLPKILNSVQGSCQSVSAIRQWAERQCQCRHARATIRAYRMLNSRFACGSRIVKHRGTAQCLALAPPFPPITIPAHSHYPKQLPTSLPASLFKFYVT